MRFEPRVTALMVALFGAVLVCLPALAATPNPNGIAVIIGNRDYTTVDVPAVTFAIADADAMKAFVVDTLGYLPANVLDLSNATQGQLNTMFGTAANPRGRLSNIVERGVSEVVVFYAGHGVPSLSDHGRYLLPVEGDPNLADLSGYPVDLLQDNLAKLGAKSVTVYLDACFTGSSSAGGQLVKGIAGTLQLTARDVPTITMLTAYRADQVASWDPAAKHGLFTEFLLRGLTGAADAAPYGNGDRNVSAGEVEKYLSATMTPKARQLYGRDQNATVSGAPTTLLAALGPAKPVGPVITIWHLRFRIALPYHRRIIVRFCRGPPYSTGTPSTPFSPSPATARSPRPPARSACSRPPSAAASPRWRPVPGRRCCIKRRAASC